MTMIQANTKKMNSSKQSCVASHGEPERSERGGAKRGRLRPLRLGAILILSTLLCACGFQPLHGREYRESLAVDLSMVQIEVKSTSSSLINATSTRIPRRYDELLKAEIADEVNPEGIAKPKRFKLEINYTEQESALFVNPDGTASRGDIIYTSSYNLIRLADQKSVATGSIQRTGSYNTSQTADYASYVSIEDARKRGVTELAQDYKLRLAALLPTLNDPHAGEKQSEPQEAVPELRSIYNPGSTHETFRERH